MSAGSINSKLLNSVGMNNSSELDLLNSSVTQHGEADSKNIMQFVVYCLHTFVVPVILLVGVIGKSHFTHYSILLLLFRNTSC